MKIRPKNWASFQHYRDRNPPWIKLHKQLLDNYEFQSLPIASKALAPMLWLIASEDAAGIIDANEPKLAFRLRLTATEVAEALKPLLDSGLFEVVQADSKALARRGRDAMPEREGQEQAETETELSAVADECAFDEFWKAYPTDKNMSRKAAEEIWAKMALGKRKAAVAAMPGFRAYCAANGWYRPVHAERFLTDERFEGYAADKPFQAVVDPSWGEHRAAQWSEALGDVNFKTYFGPAEFIDADPPILRYRSQTLRRLAADKFPKQLKSLCHGEVVLEVAA